MLYCFFVIHKHCSHISTVRLSRFYLYDPARLCDTWILISRQRNIHKRAGSAILHTVHAIRNVCGCVRRKSTKVERTFIMGEEGGEKSDGAEGARTCQDGSDGVGGRGEKPLR